jgi:hypothetical protein
MLLQWHGLSRAARAGALLVTLPLDDIDENAAMVNAARAGMTVAAPSWAAIHGGVFRLRL